MAACLLIFEPRARGIRAGAPFFEPGVSSGGRNRRPSTRRVAKNAESPRARRDGCSNPPRQRFALNSACDAGNARAFPESHPVKFEDAPSTPRQRQIALAILLAGVVCMGMGQTIVFAVLPPIARKIGMSDLEVLSIFMISALFWVLTGPLWGRRSDASGRRPFIVIGLTGFAISMTAFATVLHLGMEGALGGIALYALLLGTRSIYGVIGSATPGAAQGYIADRTPPERRTAGMSAFSAAFGVGAMVGPAFAGAVVAIDPIAPLYAVAAAAACAVGAVFFYLPERTAPKERVARPRLSPFDERIQHYLIYALASGLALSIPIQFIAFYLIDRLGLESKDALQLVGVALSAAAMASLFSQLVLVQRFNLPPATLMRIGPILICIGHAVIALSGDLGPLVFGMLLSGLGGGMIGPGYVGAASLSVTADEQGSAAGLSNAAGASGFIFAPFIGTFFYSISPSALFVATSAICAACAAYAFLEKRFERAAPMIVAQEPAEPESDVPI
jgi:MFS family permease